jgi:hypothetical protein
MQSAVPAFIIKHRARKKIAYIQLHAHYLTKALDYICGQFHPLEGAVTQASHTYQRDPADMYEKTNNLFN